MIHSSLISCVCAGTALAENHKLISYGKVNTGPDHGQYFNSMVTKVYTRTLTQDNVISTQELSYMTCLNHDKYVQRIIWPNFWNKTSNGLII